MISRFMICAELATNEEIKKRNTMTQEARYYQL